MTSEDLCWGASASSDLGEEPQEPQLKHEFILAVKPAS